MLIPTISRLAKAKSWPPSKSLGYEMVPSKRAITRHRSLYVAGLIALGMQFTEPVSAQVATYAAVINDPQNYGWYVPDRYWLAYISSADSFANPIPVGDQTLWTSMTADPVTGVFTGTTSAVFSLGNAISQPSYQSMLGTVDADGNVQILFTPQGGGNSTLGVGKFQEYGDSYQMEMQMISGSSFYITHWAYMLPYPQSFTPAQPTTIPVTNASPQWAWTAGTPWKMISPTVFGTTVPGRLVVTAYNGGYFIGQGVGANGTTSFTALGSITPEGKVLLSTLADQDATLESFYGSITGDPSEASMVLGPYDSPTEITLLSLIAPYSTRLGNNQAAIGAAKALYAITASPASLSGQWVPILNTIDSLSGQDFTNAISQTLPVLTGASSMATSQIQSAYNQVIQERQAYLAGLASGSFAGDRYVWGKVFGSLADQNDVNNVAGWSANTGALMFGFDKDVFAYANLGLSLAVGQSRLSSQSDAAPSSLDLTSYQIGIYGDYKFEGNTKLVYQIGGAINTNSSSRTLSAFSAVPGVSGNASGQYNSYVGYAGVGLNQQIRLTPQTTLTPELRLDYLSVNTDSYSESGAGNLGLNVSSQTYNTLHTTAKLRLDHDLIDGLRGSLTVGASYNALDTKATLSSSFLGGGPSFVTDGLSVSPWIFNAGVTLTGHINQTMTLGVSYNIDVSSSQFTSQMVSAELRVLF